MSDEDFPPSHFLEQLQNGDAYDESLFAEFLTAAAFDPKFDEGQVLEYPDASTNRGELASAEPQNQGKMQHSVPESGDLVNLDLVVPANGSRPAGLPMSENQPQSYPNYSGEGGAEVPTHATAPPANGSLEDHGEASSPHATVAQHDFSSEGQQVGLTSEGIRPHIESAEIGTDQERTTNHQSVTSPGDVVNSNNEQYQPDGEYQLRPETNDLFAHNVFDNLQKGGLADDRQDIDCNYNGFASEEWDDFDDPPAKEDIPDLEGSDGREDEQVPDQSENVTHDGTRINDLVAHNISDDFQQGEGQADDQQGFNLDLDVLSWQEWKDFVHQPGNEFLLSGSEERNDVQVPHQSEIVTHDGTQAWTGQDIYPSDPEPFFDGSLGKYGNPNQHPMTSLPMPAVSAPSLNDMAGPSGASNRAANTPTNNGHTADDDALFVDSDKESEEENVPNRVNHETYDENDPQINENPTQKGWGRTGERNGQEVWFNEETRKWQPSVSHHDMRETLIERAQAEYPNDSYLHPDETGGLPHGQTAFFKPHQLRGPNRQDCADELFAWRNYTPKKDEHGKPIRKGKPKYNRRHPGFMYEDGMILLDPHNNPVVDHKFIPLTLSIYTDGGKLQEMALHPECQQSDLWARMPRWEKKTNKNGEFELVPLRDRNTRINMPMTRFREKKGTIAGGDRDGTAEIMAGLLAFYEQHGFDPVASGNSVKGFPRDLKPWEIKEVRVGNAARFRQRAGNRALDDEKRDDNYEKMLKSIENGKKKQTAKVGGNNRKRHLKDEPSGFQSSSPGNQKRSRRGQEVDAGFATWDQQYAGQQGPPPFQGPQYGAGVQESPHQQQGFFQQASADFNAFEAQDPYPNIQTQPPLMQPQFNSDQVQPHFGTYSYLGQDGLYQAGYGNMQMPTASYPTYGLGGPQQISGGNDQEPVYSPYHPLPVSEAHYNIPGHVNTIPYGPPVQQQEPLEMANAPPKRGVNSLGPGGRNRPHKPKQVLGKRGERDANEIEYSESWRGVAGVEAAGPAPMIPPAVLNGAQQQQVNFYSAPDSDSDKPLKRRRQNNPAGTPPRPHRHRHHRPESIPGPQRYGAGGAPTPLPLLYQETFGTTQPGPNSNANSRVPLEFPEEMHRKISGIFGGVNRNENMRHGMSDASPRRSGPIQPVSNIYEPQQRLGKHARGEDDIFDEGYYIPQQNLGERRPTEYPNFCEQNVQMPAPKRRLLPRTEGYYAPPAQAPKAQVVKKVRKADRDAHIPPPYLHTSEPTSNPYLAPQREGTRPTPTNYIYTNGMPGNVGGAPQVANAQAWTLPQMTPSPQAVQRRPVDIREVRPVSAQEAQSLYNALQYTRDAYFEWTGEEAPVTNLEDAYNVQYREIRGAFRLWWNSTGNPRRLEPPPRLRWIRRWTGTVEDWEAPVDE